MTPHKITEKMPVAERFRLAFLASGLVAKVISYPDNVYRAFYELADAYGATNPKDIGRLASAITDRKGSPFSPPEWLFGGDDEDGDNMQNHERRAICQWSGYVHPYTCNNDECRGKTNGAPLHPKREGGWVCLHCGLHQ